eukprot:CAMPEP_0185039776 /NCGR_PEP_ID=MMETSP1103-20130426/37030_1 /TAXON_ID=36769 /ORGANISM="Paraphysomonas bandaiensis, Strain Caron Lab Isolate" /LENGTH=376 /DNA_ID=CAMNT_0027578813 /DNA_START=72 /DNA_END=1199 /DNA_ORIENTATION=-
MTSSSLSHQTSHSLTLISHNESLILQYDEANDLNSYCFCVSLHELISTLCGIWKHTDASRISYERLSTAMSNRVFVVRNDNSIENTVEPMVVLVRVLGSSGHIQTSPAEKERQRILFAAGLVPRWFGIFGNGRVEEFITCEPISARTFRTPEVFHTLARKLHKVHSLLPHMVTSQACSIRDGLWGKLTGQQDKAMKAMETLRQLYCKGSAEKGNSERSDILQDISQWGLFDYTSTPLLSAALSSSSPLVYAHCDLHHCNALLIPSQDNSSYPSWKSVFQDGYLIIDYEYAMVTTRGFDIANFICETTADYESSLPHVMDWGIFPCKEKRIQMYVEYLREEVHIDSLCSKDLLSSCLSLDNEVMAYVPFVHLQWAHW